MFPFGCAFCLDYYKHREQSKSYTVAAACSAVTSFDRSRRRVLKLKFSMCDSLIQYFFYLYKIFVSE